MNSEELKNRAESILSARANGVKLSDIAERYGISPQRAHQIAKQASGITRVRTRDDMNGIESRNGKTLPWSEDEFATVDGRPAIYSREDDVMLIRFPGGGSATPEQLARAGVSFKYPDKARGWQG